MGPGSPLIVSQALDLGISSLLKIEEHFLEMAQNPAYTSYTKFVGLDDPAGDNVYHIYTEPLDAMPEWKGPRQYVEVMSRFWQQSIRTFARAMKINVDDVKADSGRPEKMALYVQTARRLTESAMLVWPGLIVNAINLGVTTAIWQPDGQKIFDNHPVNPSIPGGSAFRNLRSKTAAGGGAAYPISYANELAILKYGYGFTAPNGLQLPVQYNAVATNPVNVPLLKSLYTEDRIAAAEAFGQVSGEGGGALLSDTPAGGDVPNKIKRQYGGDAMQIFPVANMNPNHRLYMDLSMASERPLRLKERQPITWQFLGPNGPEGAFPVGSDEGMVTEMVFHENGAAYGPKCRGEAYFSNWWRALLCDATT
jgi:hypothetical protein